MTRIVLILGLMLLAACLPLAALPLVIVVTVAVAIVVVVDAVPFAGSNAQPVALLSLALFRAPPSR